MANRRPEPAAIPIDLDRSLRDAVAKGGLPIPPYPAVALRIQEVVGRKDFGLAEVARIVSSDPALSADVLRCANSALYARGDPVAGLPQAITRIGAQEVTRLAVGSGLAVHAQAPGPLGALRRTIWIDSVVSAVVCQELARRRQLRMEEAFVLGLLHDFGKVVATTFLEALIASRSLQPRTLEQWDGLVERHHVDAGLAIAARWGLPALVSEVVARHHGAAGACQDPHLLDVVMASDRVAALLGRQAEVGEADLGALPGIRADEREVLARVVEQLPSFVAAFEAPPAQRAAPASVVAQPLTALEPGERPVAFAVQATLERRPRAYLAVAMAANGLVLHGSEALPERQMVELSLECAPRPFRIWASARASRPEGSGLRMEVVPFALAGEARTLWGQLWAAAGRG